MDFFKKNKALSLIISCVLISIVVGILSGAITAKFFTQKVIKQLSSAGSINLPPNQPSTISSQEEAVIEAVKRVSPAVVSVIITKDLPVIEQYFQNPFEGFGNDFFGQFFPEFQIPQYRQKGTEKQLVGAGTGFIVSPDGLILTNKHVVADEKAEYTVLTNDNQKIPAKVLARDPAQDLAILKIEKKNLPTVKLGDSDKLQVGQTVIAIGNALGEFENTVSVGVISGLFRSIIASGAGIGAEQLEEVIQTDAAINQGNSGGPLLNLRGEIIGVNVAMAQGAQNIGFAIPINKAKKDIDQVKTKGKISFPFLGVRYVLVNDEIQKENNLPYNYGALILRGENAQDLAVVPDSPADKAGLEENDIILVFANEKITQQNSLAKIISKYQPEDIIELKIYRQGTEKIIKVKLGEK